MCGSMADIQSAAAEIGRGKLRRKKNKVRTNHSMKIMVCLFHRATIIIKSEESWHDSEHRVTSENSTPGNSTNTQKG